MAAREGSNLAEIVVTATRARGYGENSSFDDRVDPPYSRPGIFPSSAMMMMGFTIDSRESVDPQYLDIGSLYASYFVY